jgi:hypothetical protein
MSHNQSPLKQEAQNQAENRFIADNNKKAYELLLRIQSQIDATTVIAVAPSRDSNYE